MNVTQSDEDSGRKSDVTRLQYLCRVTVVKYLLLKL